MAIIEMSDMDKNTLENQVAEILSYIRIFEEDIEHNDELFKIFEGDLLPFIEEDMRRELSPDTFNVIQPRIVPLNVLKRIIMKLSKSYMAGPIRTAENETDQELMDWYVEQMQLDNMMGLANEFFNLHKYTSLEPWVDMKKGGKPQIRVIPANQFLVYSNDKMNPTRMTAYIKFMGQEEVDDFADRESTSKKIVNKYHIFTEDQFLSTFDDGQMVSDDMADNAGVNPYGAIPFVYISRSKNMLVPLKDTDTLSMTKVIPKLLTDLVYANMFQSFSVFYGIDVDAQNLRISPNAFWQFKTDQATGTRPEVNTIKPSVDIDKTLQLVNSLMASWMESRALRPGATGTMSADNAASGISLMIQNMDTSEDRKIQNQYMKAAEEDLWKLIAHHLHPVWSASGMIPERRQFTADFAPTITFPDPIPFTPLKEKAEAQTLLVNGGLTSKRRAIMDIHGDLDDAELEKLMAEIEEDESLTMPEPSPIEEEEEEDES